jgi:basic membrane protein A and related proteins
MQFKRLLPLCLLALSACTWNLPSGSLLPKTAGNRPEDCVREDVFCAGLVTDFGPLDSGISREAWLGLQDAMVADQVDRVDYIETVDTRDRSLNIAALAAEGYDVIVTVGASMSDDTRTAAIKYPKLFFIGVEQPQSNELPNLAGLVFHEERSGFLAGALAGLITKTGYVAGVCDAKFIDPMRRYCDGFKAGALYIEPHLQVTVSYREGSSDKLFNDLDWGRTTALQQVNKGADVLFAAGGSTADAALRAATLEGVYVIGAESDLYADSVTIRRSLLSSAVSDVRLGVTKLVRLARGDEYPSGNYMGLVKLAPFHDLDSQVSAAMKDRLAKIERALQAGSIPLDIPYTSQ